MTLATRTTSQDRLFLRHRLARVFRESKIINEVWADALGNVGNTTTAWETYWGTGDRDDLSSSVTATLQVLRGAWSQYVASNFSAELTVPYCHAYFHLLRAALDVHEQGSRPWSAGLLQKVLGFESFHVTCPHFPGAMAAGTTTIRNPSYLLAKLREPLAYDDPKFLPLLVLPSSGGKPELYYHYRQYKIAESPDLSLLLYPAADSDRRSGSFRAIEAVAAGLRRKPDPRFSQRAKLIVELALQPFLAAGHVGEIIRFLHLGAGSGALAGNLFQALSKHFPSSRFACKFVDLDVRDPSIHFHSPKVRRCMSYLEYDCADYCNWLSSTGRSERYDVALLCRLLNNASIFDVMWTCDSHEISRLAGRDVPQQNMAAASFQPLLCLSQGAVSVASLIASNRKFALGGRRTFSQLSLTDYFRGIWALKQSTSLASPPPNAVFYSARQFNASSAIVGDNQSIFSILAHMARLVVTEDVDLGPEQLRNHLEKFNLMELAASDATDHVRMQSAHLLCITARQNAKSLPGKRLWY